MMSEKNSHKSTFKFSHNDGLVVLIWLPSRDFNWQLFIFSGMAMMRHLEIQNDEQSWYSRWNSFVTFNTIFPSLPLFQLITFLLKEFNDFFCFLLLFACECLICVFLLLQPLKMKIIGFQHINWSAQTHAIYIGFYLIQVQWSENKISLHHTPTLKRNQRYYFCCIHKYMTESALGVWLRKASKRVLKMNYAINAQRLLISAKKLHLKE